jgi:hypothetical protein
MVMCGLVLAPLLALADDPAPPKGWKEVKGGRNKQAYSVWLPTNAEIDEKESSFRARGIGQIRVFRTVYHPKGGLLLAAGQIILPPKLAQTPPKLRQNVFRDVFLEEFKGKLVEEKQAKLDRMNGKEYLAETPDGLARFRLLGMKAVMFRVVAVGTKEQIESKEVDDFFNSFKRLGQYKKDTPDTEKKDTSQTEK